MSENIPDGISRVLSDIRSNMTQVINGEISFPSWSPHIPPTKDAGIMSHIESLKLSSRKLVAPLLEIYNLGAFKEDPVLDSRVNSIFSINHDTCVAPRPFEFCC